MGNVKLISIIVPVYMAEKYLNRCIESILCQTYKNFELILVDDGSPDTSGDLCDYWAGQDSRVKVIHKENGGASSARNCGLKIAKGKYIAFVDSDDWLEPNMYEQLYKLLEENKAQMAICGMRVVDGKKEKNVQPNPQTLLWGRKELLDFFFKVHGEVFTYSLCRRLISKGLLDQYHFLEGRMNEDIEASFYLSVHCQRAVYTNMVFYNYYKNYNGVTNSRFTEKKLDLLYIWDVLREEVLSLAPEYIKEYEINCKRARFTLLVQMHLNKYDKKDSAMKLTKRRLKREVRASFTELIKWKMPISRKVLLVLVCIT